MVMLCGVENFVEGLYNLFSEMGFMVIGNFFRYVLSWDNMF